MTPEWWTWHAAVRKSAPSPEALAVAMVWAGVCWDWRQGDGSARPMRLDELVKHFPYLLSTRAAQRNLSQLVAAGLLIVARKHAPGRPVMYAPALPEHRTLVAGDEAEHRTLVAGDEAEHRTLVAPTLFSPDIHPPQAGAGAYVREASQGRGDEALTPNPATDEALDLLLRAMDSRWGDGTAARVAPGFRRQAAAQIAGLLAAGWTATDVADRVNAREWVTASSVGRALLARLRDLADEPAPKAIRERARQERIEKAAVPACDHGDPRGCRGCFLCRRSQPDELGVLCSCTVADDARPPIPDGLEPAGFTPSLIPVTARVAALRALNPTERNPS